MQQFNCFTISLLVIKLKHNLKLIQIFQQSSQSQKISTNENIKIPLSESLRPKSLDQIVGQKQSFGTDSMLRSMLEQNKIPNMILWGPPGCGKVMLH